jgi:transcriptional regulator of acetoin/glycerol metabolism
MPLERSLTESQKLTTSAPGGPRSERDRIVEALAACAGNQSRAAKMLGIPRRTFVTKLDAYRIPRPKKGA